MTSPRQILTSGSLPEAGLLDRPPGASLLARYRAHFAEAGITLPLPQVRAPSTGLLSVLPAPPAGRTGWPWTTESHRPAIPKSPGVPAISIIVPSFAQGAYLEEALRSILLQNYPSLELIVLDGGSKDESRAILERYSPWISLARSGPDRGQAHALNLGFALASGDIVAWLNSDDAYLPNAFTQVGGAFAADAALEFLYGDGLYLEEQLAGACYYCPSPLAWDRYLGFGGLVFSHASFWRREITEPVWEAMQCNVDGELWRRLLRQSRRRHLPLPLGLNRGQPAAKTVDAHWRQAWKDDDSRIAAVYGRRHSPGPWLHREQARVQRLYQVWIAARWRQRRLDFLAACEWRAQVP